MMQHWENRTLHEKCLLLLCGGMLLFMVIYVGVIKPLDQQITEKTQQLQQNQNIRHQMRVEAQNIQAWHARQGTVVVSRIPGKSLSAMINESALQHKINITRIQSQDISELIWLEDLSFNQLLEWLVILRNDLSVKVAVLEVTETDLPGIVRVQRLQLTS